MATKLDYENCDVVAASSKDETAVAIAKQFKDEGGQNVTKRATMSDVATLMITSYETHPQNIENDFSYAVEFIKRKGINEHMYPTERPLVLVNLHDGTDEHKKGFTDTQAKEIQDTTARPVIYSNAPVKVDFNDTGKASIRTIDGSDFKLREKDGIKLLTSSTLEILPTHKKLLEVMTSPSKRRLPKTTSTSDIGSTSKQSKLPRGMSL